MKKVLMSIKPNLALLIFDGKKKYEFRRSMFKDRSIDTVVVYATAPISKVVGEFKIDRIIFGSTLEIWREAERFAGISYNDFLRYFRMRVIGHAIKIKSAKLYENFLPITDFCKRPPQSFLYLR